MPFALSCSARFEFMPLMLVSSLAGAMFSGDVSAVGADWGVCGGVCIEGVAVSVAV